MTKQERNRVLAMISSREYELEVLGAIIMLKNIGEWIPTLPQWMSHDSSNKVYVISDDSIGALIDYKRHIVTCSQNICITFFYASIMLYLNAGEVGSHANDFSITQVD